MFLQLAFSQPGDLGERAGRRAARTAPEQVLGAEKAVMVFHPLVGLGYKVTVNIGDEIIAA